MRIGKSRLNLTAGIRLSKNIFFGDGISGALEGRGVFGTSGQALAISPQLAQAAATFGTTSAAQLPYLAQAANTFGADHSATAISAYDPTQDPDLFDWWNAQSGIQSSGAGELQRWTGSNGNDADPPTVTARPLYGDSQINGLDVLTFRNADPNYLQIDTSSLNSGCDLHMVINSSTLGIFMCNSATVNNRIYYASGDSGNFATNFGSTVGVYKNGVFLYNNPTRDQVWLDFNNTECLMSLTGLNFSSINTVNLFVRENLSSPMSTLLADLIISTGNTKFSENTNFLIDKYAL